MNLEPPNLGIPLHRRSRFWPWLVIGVCLFGAVSFVLSPGWGKSFLAAAALTLPAFALGWLAPIGRRRSGVGAAPATLAIAAAIIAYLLVAKRVLLPWILERL